MLEENLRVTKEVSAASSCIRRDLIRSMLDMMSLHRPMKQIWGLFVSHPWGCLFLSAQELTSLAGKLDLATKCPGRNRNFSFSLNTLWQDQASPLEMSVLGHVETGNSKDVTQQDSTQRLQNCLIGRCNDMMFSLDLTKVLGTQEEAAGTCLVTRKFSSSIFCWKELHKSQEGESKNTKQKS